MTLPERVQLMTHMNLTERDKQILKDHIERGEPRRLIYTSNGIPEYKRYLEE